MDHTTCLALLAGALLVGGCAAPGPDGAPPTPTTTSSAAASVAQGARPATYEQAQRSASRLMLRLEEYPGSGWQKGGPLGRDDFPETICGVRNEPVAPAGAFASRKVQPDGLAVFQDVRPVGAEQATRTVQELSRALRTCRTDTRTVAGRQVTADVARVAVQDPQAVAYRRSTTTGQRHGVWRFQVYLVADDSLVAFTTFSTSPEPPTAFLDALVAAVRAKQ